MVKEIVKSMADDKPDSDQAPDQTKLTKLDMPTLEAPSPPPKPKPDLLDLLKPIRDLLAVVKAVVSELSTTPLLVLISTVVAFMCVAANVLIAAVFLIVVLKQYINNTLIKNPLNKQAQDYNISKIGSITNSYTVVFLLFVIINAVGLGFSAFGIYQIAYKMSPEARAQTSPSVYLALFACTVQSAIGFVSALAITIVMASSLRSTAKRIQSFNTYVYDHLYKDAEFLKQLMIVPSNSFFVTAAVENAVKTLPVEATDETIAKAMFSINMFMHFQKMGARNPYLAEAISKTFNLTGLLRRRLFSPANYMHRRSTFIKDNSDVTRDMLIKSTAERFPVDTSGAGSFTKRVDSATMMAADWTSEASNLANMFFPEDAMRTFVGMFTYMLLAQTLPVFVVWYMKARLWGNNITS